MQGGGFYNRNSGLQAANLTSALPLFEDAARTVPLAADGPIVIVDYGASQGRNSLVPMKTAIAALRERAGAARPIEIVHTDLASNDFASLFTMLEDDPASYVGSDAAVFPSAIGRSYLEPLLPPGRVDLGWTSNALHWMSRSPVDVPDHGWAVFSASQAARDAVDRQLAEDWERFLRARGTELRPGGRLVCQFMGRGPDSHGFEWMANAFWSCWSELRDEGLLSDDDLLHMTAPSAGRSVAQIEAPFADGPFAGLHLAHLAIVEAPDPYFQAYQDNGDAEALGRGWANMMRAANGPNFTARLGPERDRTAILDAVTARLAARIAAAPQRSRSYNVLLVLEKVG